MGLKGATLQGIIAGETIDIPIPELGFTPHQRHKQLEPGWRLPERPKLPSKAILLCGLFLFSLLLTLLRFLPGLSANGVHLLCNLISQTIPFLFTHVLLLNLD